MNRNGRITPARRVLYMYVRLFHAVGLRAVVSSVQLIYVQPSVIHRFGLHPSLGASIDKTQLAASVQRSAISMRAADLACSLQVSLIPLPAVFPGAMTSSSGFDVNAVGDPIAHSSTFCKGVHLGAWKVPGLHAEVRFPVYGCRDPSGRIVRRIFLETTRRTVLLKG